MENYKAKDIEAITAFMRGKDAVLVQDIIQEAGADKMRVYSLIAELHLAGKLQILETEDLGSPKLVKLL